MLFVAVPSLVCRDELPDLGSKRRGQGLIFAIAALAAMAAPGASLAQSHPEFIALGEETRSSVHGFTPCTSCQTTPGQYSNGVRNLFDCIRDWTNKRI